MTSPASHAVPSGARAASIVDVRELLVICGYCVVVATVPDGHARWQISIRHAGREVRIDERRFVRIGDLRAADRAGADVAVSAFPLDRGIAASAGGADFEILDGESGSPRRRHATPLTAQQLAGHRHLVLIHAWFARWATPDLAEVVASRILFRPADRLKHMSIREAARGRAAWAIRGGTKSAKRRFHLVADDLDGWVPHGAVLRGEGAVSATDGAPFAAVLQASSAGGFFVVSADPRSASATYYGPFGLDSELHAGRAVELVAEVCGDPWHIPPEEAEHVFRPLIARPARPVGVARLDFDPPGLAQAPIYSLIVPFHGDASLVTCVFHLQRELDARFEIVVVCDDPRIWPALRQSLGSRRRTGRVKTVLLRNQENCGYGAATNVGARAASGRVLFLVNSDVLIKTRDRLVEAARLIEAEERAGAHLVVGFSLRFEDNTFQHVGIEFARSRSLRDLFIAKHPLKGTPASWYTGPARRRVPAATGALLAISRRLFTELGGYDPQFGGGDFEDADLCLRARTRGASVVVLMRPGLFHLERQSIRRLATPLRSATTYLNCIAFNRRWGQFLSAKVRVFRGTRNEAAAAQAAA